MRFPSQEPATIGGPRIGPAATLDPGNTAALRLAAILLTCITTVESASEPM